MRSKLRGQQEGRLINSSGTFPTSFIGSRRGWEGIEIEYIIPR